MALPKINHPIHTVFLKSLNKEVRYRPFLVKEEKLLLIAKESQDNTDIRSTVVQILQNCCLDELDINSLPLFDIEMFFIHLRMKSIGDSAKLQFTCENPHAETKESCGHVTDYTLNLNNIKYYQKEDISDVIYITDKIGLKLKYPTLSVFNIPENDFDAALKIIANNVDYVFDAESVYKKDSISEEELLAFLEELNIDNIEQIRKFLASSPKVVLEDTITCKKCGFEHTLRASELYSFFI